jgi:putative transposase
VHRSLKRGTSGSVPSFLRRVREDQKSLWEEWDTPDEEIRKVAEKFVLANCFDPQVAGLRFVPP